MKLIAAICVLLAASIAAGAEEITPVGAGLREEANLWVTCALREAPRAGKIPVLPWQTDCEKATGIYHYKLWLPHGYLGQPQRRWPCVFIASPFGNAQMGDMTESLRRTHVVVMLVESRNGPWPPTIGNFLAAHDDVVKRIRIQEGGKIATGLSGGARASSVFVQLRPGFCGAILQGASVPRNETGRPYFYDLLRNQSILIAMVIGRDDPRRTEIFEMERQLGAKRFAVLLFPGGHQWAPPDSFAKALNWIESRARYSRS
jgi:hypothetical protein